VKEENVTKPEESSSSERPAQPGARYVEMEELALHLYREAIENTERAPGHWYPTTQRNWMDRLREMAAMLRSGQVSLQATLKNLDKRVGKLEADVQKQEQLEASQTKWPAYAIADFQELTRHAEAMRNAVGDASQVLFHTLELETLLERAEQKARNADQKYEGRLAATLRDICRVHDPGQFTEEQASCLKGSITALVEGWGRLTREKLKYVRTHLLDVGLTWLPVTDKALSDLKEAAGRG
jgi:hypothetical protein